MLKYRVVFSSMSMMAGTILCCNIFDYFPPYELPFMKNGPTTYFPKIPAHT